jgi:hypothetical protein
MKVLNVLIDRDATTAASPAVEATLHRALIGRCLSSPKKHSFSQMFQGICACHAFVGCALCQLMSDAG